MGRPVEKCDAKLALQSQDAPGDRMVSHLEPAGGYFDAMVTSRIEKADQFGECHLNSPLLIPLETALANWR